MAGKVTLPVRGSRRTIARVALYEAWPVVVVVFGMVIALARISTTAWAPLLFENADSVVLPLLEQSLRDGDPMNFVLSSQLFLFPEGPIYLFASLFTNSARLTLAINAVLNVVLMYSMFRVIALLLAHRARHRFIEITIALVATTIFTVMVLLEPTATVNRSGLATPLLSSTYYYGVVLSGLAIVALTLWVAGSFGNKNWTRRRIYIYAAAVVLVAGLTTLSNPLFVMQVFAPIVATAVVLVFVNRITWRQFAIVAGWNLAGIGFGFVLREFFSGLLPAQLAGYLSLEQIPESIKVLYSALQEMLATDAGTLKLIILISLQIMTAILFVFALYAQSRPTLAARVSSANFFILTFVSISSVSLLVGMVGTGSITTRYLEPLTVFPLMTVVAVGIYVLRHLLADVQSADLRRNVSRFSIGIAAAASALLVVVGAISVPTVARTVDGDYYTGANCLNDFVGDSDINGVASFWTARPFELYGEQSGDVLQVDTELAPYAWMINLGAYEDKTFSYVIVDQTPYLLAESLNVLGEPAQVIACGTYNIYDYQGTAGEQILTDTIEDSLAKLEE